MRLLPPNLYTHVFFFYSVWDYVPHVSYQAGHVAASGRVSNDRATLIAWT